MVTIKQFKMWALSFPEATEEAHFEKTSFRIKEKIFATYDDVNKRACLKLSAMDQHLFSKPDKTIIYPVDNKWGKQGWTLIEMKTIKGNVFFEVLTTAYCEVAPKKLSDQVRTTETSKPAKRQILIMNKDIQVYNNLQIPEEREICNTLAHEINLTLHDAENKIWHAHPVWFLEGNPIVGYSKLKDCIRLLFWSGQSFEEEGLSKEGTFKAAEMRYTSPDQIHKKDLKRWLKKSREIQWDYKNIVKRKGVLERLK